jgi:hypothetical protein
VMNTDDAGNDGLEVMTIQWFGIAIRELKLRMQRVMRWVLRMRMQLIVVAAAASSSCLFGRSHVDG